MREVRIAPSPHSPLVVVARASDVALLQFTAMAGAIPMMPARSYGVWWSRYWPYSEAAIKDVVRSYETHGLPLNMLVLDVDWHDRPGSCGGCPLPTTGCFNYGKQPFAKALKSQCFSGYGGYNWNATLFMQPKQFQRYAHERGLQMMLNLHSQCGIDRCQHEYKAAQLMMGLPQGNVTIPCNVLAEKYAATLYQTMLSVGDNAAVDYWWEDYGVDFHSAGENQTAPLSTHVDTCEEPNVGGHAHLDQRLTAAAAAAPVAAAAAPSAALAAPADNAIIDQGELPNVGGHCSRCLADSKVTFT